MKYIWGQLSYVGLTDCSFPILFFLYILKVYFLIAKNNLFVIFLDFAFVILTTIFYLETNILIKSDHTYTHTNHGHSSCTNVNNINNILATSTIP